MLGDQMNISPAYLTAIVAALTLVVAAMVAQVGYQQFKLARERFKLDLFEKRFAVYKAAQRLLSIVVQDGKVELNDLFEYRRDTQDAVFLFGQEVVDYLEMLDRKALELENTKHMYDPLPVGSERRWLCEKALVLLKDLGNELPRLKDVFGRYLRFQVWK
jgi:hypothetical protein